MAIIFIDGFDTYNGTGGAAASSVGAGIRWTLGGSPSMTTGRFSGQSLLFSYSSSTTFGYATLPSTQTSGTIGVACYMAGAPNGNSAFSAFLGGAGHQFTVNMNANQSISIYRGGTVLGTSATLAFPLNAWFYIEVEFTIDGTTGAVRVYVNGASVLSLSNVNNKAQSGTGFNILYLSSGASYGVGNSAYYDDIYVTDTGTRLGEQRVITLNANGDSTPSQWTSSTGGAAPYTMVDETLCNADTDYISADTVDYRAMFTMADLASTPNSIAAVQLGAYSRKTDAGTRTVQLQYEGTDTTTYTSSQFTLASTYTRQLDILATNPLTSSAWTGSDVNSMKVGVKVAV